MPYVLEEHKKILKNGAHPMLPGQLNYKDYVDDKGLSYDTINDIIGALEGAKLEFYRRVAVPYEDLKIKENGDIY